MPFTPTQQLTADVLAWPGTSVRLGSRGEYGIDAHGHELGHLHGDRVAHFFFFDRELGTQLREAGRVGPHPVKPESVKLGAREIRSELDVADIRTMLRLNYERPLRKLVAQLEASIPDVDATADLLTEAATVVSDEGRRVAGREAFRAAVKAARAAGAPVPQLRLEFTAATFLSEGLAIVSLTRHRGPEPGSDADPAPAPVHLTLTVVRAAKNWLIASMQATPFTVAPVPGVVVA